MDKQVHDQQKSLENGANSQDDQQHPARLSSQPTLSQVEQAEAATGKRLFGQLFKGIRPLDISGESEVIEEGLPDDEANEQPVITDLGPMRRRPSSLPVLTNLTRAQRLLTAGIAATIVLSLLATGLIVLPRLTTGQVAHPAPRVLFQTTSLGSLALPAWGEPPIPGSSFVNCVNLPSTSSATPQASCTFVSARNGPINIGPFLSFVDNAGNCYAWSQGMQKPTKSITLQSFPNDPSATWRWLYPGHYLLSQEQAGSVSTYKIWDTVQNRLLFTTNDTLPFAMRPDGTIATLTAQHTVQILRTQDLLQESNSQIVILIPSEAVTETLSSPSFSQLVALSWSPDGSQLATASSDGTIQIWGMEPPIRGSAPLFLTLPAAPPSQMYAPPFLDVGMVWSPDGRRLAVAASTSTGSAPIQIWDLRSRRLIQSYSGNAFPVITNMAWLDDNRTMLTSSFNQLVLWDTTTGRTMMSAQQGMTYLPGQVLQPPLSLNKHLLAFPLADSIQLIDAQTGKILRILQSSRSKDYFVAINFSPDNRHLAALDIYGQIQVWNVQSGQREASYKLPGNFSQLDAGSLTNGYWLTKSLAALAWSPDGSMLAATYQDGMVVLGIPQLS